MAVALESCSVPVKAPEAVTGWYEGTLYEDKPFYITKNAISWTSGTKKADFGHWTAVSVYDPTIRLKAEGGTFTISPGYGWTASPGEPPRRTCCSLPCFTTPCCTLK